MRGQSVDLKRCFLASRKKVVDIRIGEVDFLALLGVPIGLSSLKAGDA